MRRDTVYVLFCVTTPRNRISWIFILAGNSIQRWLQQVHAILNGIDSRAREPSSYTQQNMTRHKSTQSSPSFLPIIEITHRDDETPGPTHADSPVLLPTLRLRIIVKMRNRAWPIRHWNHSKLKRNCCWRKLANRTVYVKSSNSTFENRWTATKTVEKIDL